MFYNDKRPILQEDITILNVFLSVNVTLKYISNIFGNEQIHNQRGRLFTYFLNNGRRRQRNFRRKSSKLNYKFGHIPKLPKFTSVPMHMAYLLKSTIY
jgi:hypothetical protein